ERRQGGSRPDRLHRQPRREGRAEGRRRDPEDQRRQAGRPSGGGQGDPVADAGQEGEAADPSRDEGEDDRGHPDRAGRLTPNRVDSRPWRLTAREGSDEATPRQTASGSGASRSGDANAPLSRAHSTLLPTLRNGSQQRNTFQKPCPVRPRTAFFLVSLAPSAVGVRGRGAGRI